MSNVARGKLHVAQRDGLPIPPDWAIDPEGFATTDVTAALAGSILPAGGHKGLAFAMIVEVLAGALTGARPLLSEGGAPGGVGAFGFVLDPAEIAGTDVFEAIMSEWTSHYHAAAGAHGRIPGERAAEMRIRAEREGIEIEAPLRLLLVELGETAGIEFTD
jgi:LDH2 family malate/lactate/ureidoglycolate dehydrogenase